MKVGEWLAGATRRLTADFAANAHPAPALHHMQSEPRAPVEADNSPRLDSELLLAHALGQSRTWLYTWPDAELDPDDVLRANALLERRAAGEPVAYLTGLREFWSMNLEVSPAVLVPRPDTELLVEQALAFTEANAAGQIIELGTGSGAIAIALATECSWPIIATDRSAAALDVARRNAERFAPGRITFVQGDWLDAFDNECASLIISNPPYLAADDPHLSNLALTHEPGAALVAAEAGLADIRQIVQGSTRVTCKGGPLMLEHGHEQGASVRQIMHDAGLTLVETVTDLAGNDRVTRGVSQSSLPDQRQAVTPLPARRILILGNGGAGKSTLATALSAYTDLPVIHLDKLYWRAGWEQTPRSEWVETLQRLMVPDAWILDGNYRSTLAQRVERADALVLLDPPTLVCLWRIARRRFGARQTADLAEGCDDRLQTGFVRYVAGYRRTHLPDALAMCTKASATSKHVLHIRGRADPRQIAIALGHDGGRHGLTSGTDRK